MKKIFLLGMVAGLLASCQSKTDGYTIEGTLTGDAASGKAYLERSVYLSDPVVVDSTVVQNGSFTFSGKVERPGLYYVIIDLNKPGEEPDYHNKMFRTMLYLENSDITYKGDVATLPGVYYASERESKSPEITGSSVHDLFVTMNKEIQVKRLGNTTERQDEISTTPIEYESVSLFNPQDGFASFLIPAVLILIIQQTLLLGVGLSAGTARENNRFRDLVPISRQYQGTLRIVLGKSLAYLMIYTVMSTYILCLVPKIFSLVQIAQPATLFWFTLPYLLACIFFAMTCSIFVHHRESCMLIFVFTSVPLLFISGISWPGAAIPKFWEIFSWLFPSTFGINGYVRINTMGATLHDVLPIIRGLWIQAVVYFITTCIVYRRQIMLSRKHALERLKTYRNKKRLQAG